MEWSEDRAMPSQKSADAQKGRKRGGMTKKEKVWGGKPGHGIYFDGAGAVDSGRIRGGRGWRLGGNP